MQVINACNRDQIGTHVATSFRTRTGYWDTLSLRVKTFLSSFVITINFDRVLDMMVEKNEGTA